MCILLCICSIESLEFVGGCETSDRKKDIQTNSRLYGSDPQKYKKLSEIKITRVNQQAVLLFFSLFQK